jgi:hypothetical protein
MHEDLATEEFEFDPIKIQWANMPLSIVLYPYEYSPYASWFANRVTCEIEHLTGRFFYENSRVTFLTDNFDRFLLDLSSVTQGKLEQARFEDLDHSLVFTITQNSQRKTAVKLTIYRPSPNHREEGRQEVGKLEFSADIDPEMPAAILSKLREYHRWWLHRDT